MRSSPVLRLDRSIARTAFVLGDGARNSTLADANATLELRRAGEDDLIATLIPLEIDGDGQLVFAWNDTTRCLASGLYVARLTAQCALCGEGLLQFGEPCAVMAVANIAYSPDCDGPDDTCAMSTFCAAVRPSCDCASPPAIYVPPYEVPRGC